MYCTTTTDHVDISYVTDRSVGRPWSPPPEWPLLRIDQPLRKLLDRLDDIVIGAGYDEMYGITLQPGPPFPFTTTLILQKFLRANANDVWLAAKQLRDTLIWRKQFQPLRSAEEEVFDLERFGGLGYMTLVDGKKKKKEEEEEGGLGQVVVTWNVYSAIKDRKLTFGDLDG